LESWASGLKAEGCVRAMNSIGEVFLVADILARGGALAGFCSYAGDRVHGLYIHPDWVRRGLAGAMLARAEAAILAAGARRIALTASLIAHPLYARRGYATVRRVKWKTRGGLVIEAFAMEKKMPPLGHAGS
jgi:GNAT superfamily N-acetyltransferase